MNLSIIIEAVEKTTYASTAYFDKTAHVLVWSCKPLSPESYIPLPTSDEIREKQRQGYALYQIAAMWAKDNGL